MTTYSPEFFKLRCMNVNWRLSQMALEIAALCISRPLFQDLSQRKRITSPTQKMIQLWPQRFLSGKRMGSTYWFDNIYQYFTCTSCQWQIKWFHPFLAFTFGVFNEFFRVPTSSPRPGIWRIEPPPPLDVLDSKPGTAFCGEVDALKMACWGEETKMDDTYIPVGSKTWVKKGERWETLSGVETSISLLKALLEVEHNTHL